MATIKACKDCRTLHVEREPYAWVALCDCYDGAPDSPPQCGAGGGQQAKGFDLLCVRRSGLCRQTPGLDASRGLSGSVTNGCDSVRIVNQ